MGRPARRTASSKLQRKAPVRRPRNNEARSATEDDGVNATVGNKWPAMYTGMNLDSMLHGRSKFGLLTVLHPLLRSMVNLLLSANLVLREPPNGFNEEDCEAQLKRLERCYRAKHRQFKVGLGNVLKQIAQKIGSSDGKINWSPTVLDPDKLEEKEHFCKTLQFCHDAKIITFSEANLANISEYCDAFHIFLHLLLVLHL